MAKTRLQLHDVLTTIVDNAYYNPPESLKLKYPCIIYSLDSDATDYADDSRYKNMNRYSLILIGDGPESTLKNTLLSLPYCRFDREYYLNNLCHDALTIFF